jgi:hypothetical protein
MYSMHAHVMDESRALKATDQQQVPTWSGAASSRPGEEVPTPRAAATDTQWGRRCHNFNEHDIAIDSIIGRDDGGEEGNTVRGATGQPRSVTVDQRRPKRPNQDVGMQGGKRNFSRG